MHQAEELQILILEDRSVDAELMMIELKREGIPFRAVRVSNETDFLAALETRRHHLVLADYALPSFDGLTALKLVRERQPTLPFILVSGSLGEELAVQALHDGATDYLLKQRLARLGPAVRRAMREAAERSRLQKAEEELRRSEENYREIFNATHEAIFVHDAETGEILDVNQTMLDMFGYSRDELPGMTGDAFRTEEPYSHAEALRRIRLAGTEGPQVFEWLSKRKNGERFWTEVALRATRIGGEGRVLAVVRDITERKQSQAALVRAKEDWERTFDAVPDLIAILDAEHRVVRANRAMAERLRTSPEQCVGLRCFEVVHGTEAPPLFCPHAQLLRDGREHDAEVCEARLGGHFHVSTSPLRDTDGKLIGSVHVARDITDRKRAEIAMRASEERFRRMFEAATEGIALANPETGEILDCNEAFLKLTGYARHELIGQSQTMLHPRKMEHGEVSPTFAEHRGPKQGAILSEVLITKSGATKNVEIKANLLDIGGCQVLQAFFRDVTAELRYDYERETTLKLLRLLNDDGNTHDLIRNLTGFLQQWTGCDAVGVRLREGDDFPYFETRGFPVEFVHLENALCQRDSQGQIVRDEKGEPILECLCGMILRGESDDSKPCFTPKGSFWTNSTTDLLASDPDLRCQTWIRHRCRTEGYESVALFALRHGSEVHGLLQLNDRARNKFTPITIRFLEDMADQIAMALAQRQTQAALRLSERRFRDVSVAAGECIWEVDVQGRLTYISERVETMIGYRPGELLGRPFFDLLDTLEREQISSAWRQAIGGRQTLRDYEVRVMTKSGGTICASLSAVPVIGPSGEVVAFRGVTQDITPRKEAEGHIRHLNQLLGAIRDINKLIVRERDPRRLLHEACASLQRTRGYLLVWVACPEPGSTRVVPLAQAGARVDYLDRITVTMDESVTGQGPVGTALRTRQPQVCQATATDERFAPWRAPALERGFQSVASMPMLHGERLFGVINVYADHPDAFDAEELGLLEELARDLALALQSIEHEQERQRVEASLRESEARIRQIIEASPIPLAIDDLAGNVEYVNRKFTATFGYELADIPTVEQWSQLAYPDPEYRQAIMTSWQSAVDAVRQSGGEIPLVEAKVTCKDGSVRFAEFRGCFVGDRGLIAINDITERKRAEMALIESQTRFQQVTEHVGEWVWEVNADGLYTYSSPAGERVHGHRSEEMVGKLHFYDLFPFGQKEALRASAMEVFSKKLPFVGFKNLCVHKDGHLVLLETNGTPITDPQGNLLGYRGVDSDITERERTEARIREQASLLDLAQDAIVVRDLEGRVQFWNQGAANLYGWAAAEAMGHKVTDLYWPDGDRFQSAMKHLLEAGHWEGEVHQKSKDQREVVAYCRWTLVRDVLGQPKSVLAINTDLTERKKLEAQFLRAQRLEGIGALASGIAHDLNNILAPVLMIAPILHDSLPDKETRKLLDTVENSARRGADIIKQLLTFARGQPGARVLLPVRHLLRDMDKIIRETFPRDIKTKVQTSEALWPLLGDPTQVHQTLLNLCVNARDAMPEGGTMTLEARNVTLDESYANMAPDARPGDYVCVSVTDTGTGIPEDHLDRIFDPFFTTKEVGHGTGLGLATVLGIVRGHEGFVRVASRVGRGTTFELYFPAAVRTDVPAEPKPEQEAPQGQGELILVVDDEQAVRESLRRTLEMRGYRVLVAVNGAEGLAFFSEHRAEVRAVLTDAMMPVMGGPAMVQALRAMAPELPVVVMTGLPERNSLKNLENLSNSLLLPKPFSGDELLRVLGQLLAKPTSPSGQTAP